MPSERNKSITMMRSSSKPPTGKTAKTNAIAWSFRDGTEEFARPFVRMVEDPKGLAQWSSNRLVRKTNKRRVWRSEFTGDAQGQRWVYIKELFLSGILERIKFIIKLDQSHREMRALRRVNRCAIPTYEVIATGREGPAWWPSRFFVISRAVEGASVLAELLNGSKGLQGAQRERLITDLGEFIAYCHEKGLEHKDLHAGNLLARFSAGRWMFFVIDLSAAKVRKGGLSSHNRWKNLAMIIHSLTSWLNGDECRVFLEAYEVESGHKIPLGLIRMLTERLKRRWHRSRTKKCLKDGSRFSKEKTDRFLLLHKAQFPMEDFLKSVTNGSGRFAFLDEPRDAFKKYGRKSAVIRWRFYSATGQWSVCIKHYRDRGLWDRVTYLFRHSRARRAWVSGNALELLNAPVPRVWACVETRNKILSSEGLLIMDDLDDAVPLPNYFSGKFLDTSDEREEARKREFLREVGSFLFEIHEKGVYHGDLKASNVLVGEWHDRWRFFIVDFDSIRTGKSLGTRKRVRNFQQFFNSFPFHFKARDASLLLNPYCDGIRERERDQFLRGLRRCVDL